MKGKVLVLGGGLLQIPLIKMAKEKGYKVYLADYYENPPAKEYCDDASRISTFSIEENYNYALEKKINYVMTIGSDQPVYTAAIVSERLALPHPISGQQGRSFTNKHYMKEIMLKNNLPTPKFKTVSSFKDFDFSNLSFPIVLKPADSQGQRGIAVLKGDEGEEQLRKLFEEAKGFSSSSLVILEEFYQGDEITVNCWVKAGTAYCLLITDRLHYEDEVVLGICKQQRYPSQAAAPYLGEIQHQVQALVDAFEIEDGPLYIQMMVGNQGPQFIEFGYRIGGGFESEIIPMVTGIDILELYFALVTEGKNLFQPEKIEERFKNGAISFLFTNPGFVKKIALPEDFGKYGKMFIKEGDQLSGISNATSRAGCFTFYSNDPEEYYAMLERYDKDLALFDEQGRDLLIHGLWE